MTDSTVQCRVTKWPGKRRPKRNMISTMMMMLISSVCILDLSELSSTWEEVEKCIFQPMPPCSRALPDRPLPVSKSMFV